jgi:preprotein translocase subunit SecA
MKNYYEVLGLEDCAAGDEIKRAYLLSLKKYPSDKFYDEFVQIRQAYGVLGNERTKAQYDELLNLSSADGEVFDVVRNFMDNEAFEEAVTILEKILKVKPDNLIVKLLLGEAYIQNGNSGKAIKLYEELVAEHPDNAAFRDYLAEAYLSRGWQKRAADMYKEAIRLDEDNLYLWVGYIQTLMTDKDFHGAREAAMEAIQKARENKTINTTLYMQLMMIDLIKYKYEDMQASADELLELSLKDKSIRENSGWTFENLARIMLQSGLTLEASKLISKVHSYLPECESILLLKEELENFEKIGSAFESLEVDNSFGDGIKDMIALEISGEEDLELNALEKQSLTFLHELNFLEEISLYKTELKKFKLKYPELYDLKKEFFNSALDHTKYKKMLKDYRSKRSQKKAALDIIMKTIEEKSHLFEDERYEDEDYYEDFKLQETFVREEPKTGRNDPCPCLSGKKYKKCCGR